MADVETMRRPDSCVMQGRRPDGTGTIASAVACCCEKWWWEGDSFESYGGRACERCLKGECRAPET